jgi:hypothetical protein
MTTLVPLPGALVSLSRLRERVRVRAILVRRTTPTPSAPALIPAFSRKREKGNSTRTEAIR